MSDTKQYSDEELLDHLRELADDDDGPTVSEVNSAEGPSVTTYQYHFESFNEAVKRAGLEVNRDGRLEHNSDGEYRQYTDEELLSWIRVFVFEFGCIPRPSDAASWPGPSKQTYQRRFDGWKAAVREAGFEPAGGGSDE